MYYVYGLHLDGDDEVRYVGSTNKPKYRLWRHLNGKIQSNPARRQWIEANRETVRMKILETVESDPRGAERRAIDALRKAGHRLLNVRRPRSVIPVKQDLVNAPGDLLGITL